ncbi:MAG: agmatinase [Pseudomonadota bacterium]
MLNKVALLGACHDHNSSFMRGSAAAPAAIRTVLHNGSANLTSESGLNLSAPGMLHDLGDLDVEQTCAGVMQLADSLSAVIAQGFRPLTLGGDHAITFPLVKAVYERYGVVDILHFDAHSDTYPEFDDNPNSHASPFARIVEQGYVGRLVQVGIRTMTDLTTQFTEAHAIEVLPWRGELPELPLTFERPVYVSIDIDALDPAFAPGVSHHEPGGMSVRDVLQILQGLRANVVAADIVEYNPARDWHDMTAMVCAKFVKELAALLATSTSQTI